MKNLKLFLLTALAATSIVWMAGCDNEDDVQLSTVNFEEETYERTTDDLSAFDVTLAIDPAAGQGSEITIAAGEGSGTTYTTTPAVSGGQIVLSVAEGATTASFTFTPLEEGIGFDNVEVEFSLGSTGAGLTTGLTTSTTVSIFNNLDTGEPFPYTEDFSVCADDGSGEFPPAGWEQIAAQQNAEGSAVWQCTTFPGVAAVINPFVAGSDDTSGSEVWLVSPRINLLEASGPTLSFDVDRRFAPTDGFEGDPVDVLVSTDYTGNNFEESTWERFDAGYDAIIANDPGTDNLENTGELDFSAYAGNVVAIAFVHRAGAPGSFDATILRVGNVVVD